ncbi:MAG TPA: LuxR C-terminal-related transcriptional regulator [Coxiellaceae bacterium]|nr:LuxR C-terminal-related transcriptional regulator [Coxiellaceae bacterium]
MYWDKVLQEVLNKEDASYPCVFTNIKKPLMVSDHTAAPILYRAVKEDDFRVYLGKECPGIYFTRRECQCMLMLLKGKTMKESGSNLNLSARTVEYYVKNMKIKTKSRTRSELISVVLMSDFMRHVKKEGLF